MKKYILFSMLLALLGIAENGAYAQGAKIAEQPCDPKYWDSLTARAWLEAEREIIQNQNLIFKPDSVLEYVCFDKFVDHTAAKGGDIFVHTEYFGRKIIQRGTNESMEKGLENVVYNALTAYDTGSFRDQLFMSDRAVKITNNGGASSYDHPMRPSASGSYNCGVMQKVWKTAKCINCIDNADFKNSGDAFYPFKQLKGLDGSNVAGYQDSYSGEKDPRQWPANLKCKGPSLGEWQDKNDLSENIADVYKFKEPLALDFKKVRDKIEPGGKDGTTCGSAILTGVKVIINGTEKGDDGVCTNPGCTYIGNGKCS